MARYSLKFGIKNSKMLFSPGGIHFLMHLPDNSPIFCKELLKASKLSRREVTRKIKLFIAEKYIEIEDVITNNGTERKISLTRFGRHVRARLEKLVEAAELEK